MNVFKHKEYCGIVRHENHPQLTELIDEEGEVVYAFPKEWTDEQIWTALAFANKAWRYGFECGQIDIREDFRRLMKLPREEQL